MGLALASTWQSWAIVTGVVVAGCLIGLLSERVGRLEWLWRVGATLAIGGGLVMFLLAEDAWKQTSDDGEDPISHMCRELHEDRPLPNDVRRALRNVCPDRPSR